VTPKAGERGTAFRHPRRSDLNWILTVQTEGMVGKDSTVAIADRSWQIDKSLFRCTPDGRAVAIHEQLDGTIPIRYGPHVVREATKGK
jgi:hypothetical protein